ncbi:MAG: hypothetical protein AB1349_07500 [Elusimicrobiota bacterium]
MKRFIFGILVMSIFMGLGICEEKPVWRTRSSATASQEKKETAEKKGTTEQKPAIKRINWEEIDLRDYYGMRFNTVIEKLGIPDSLGCYRADSNDSNYDAPVLRYKGASLFVGPATDTIYLIMIFKKECPCKIAGVRMGDTEERVIEILGEPTKKDVSSEGDYYILRYLDFTPKISVNISKTTGLAINAVVFK